LQAVAEPGSPLNVQATAPQWHDPVIIATLPIDFGQQCWDPRSLSRKFAGLFLFREQESQNV
jgi:hypothetical protein